MQAILTKFLPPTNCRPARILARCARGCLTMTADNAHEVYHVRACAMLIALFRE